MITVSEHPILNIAIECICECFGVSREELVDRSRRRNLVNARHAYCSLVVNEYNSKRKKAWQRPIIFSQIGGAIDRDHSTVIYSATTSHKIRMGFQEYSDCYLMAVHAFNAITKNDTAEDIGKRKAELEREEQEREEQELKKQIK